MEVMTREEARQQNIDNILKRVFTQQDKENYRLFNQSCSDFMLYGQEIFHVDAEGNARQIPVMSKEGQDVLDKLNK